MSAIVADRAARAMGRHEVGQRRVGEDVAVERQERAGDAPARRVPDAARSAHRTRLDDVLEREAERALAEAGLNRVRQVAAAEDDARHAGLGEPLEHVREQRAAEQRENGLGALQRERPKPRALPSDEHDGVHGLTLAASRPAGSCYSPRPTPS